MFIKLFYCLKPCIPRRVQLAARRMIARRKLAACSNVWPIDPDAAAPPPNWRGWPGGKKFALVLTHDVETQRGHDRCLLLAEAEKSLGFRSSFNFVPERYCVSPELRKQLTNWGFEVGVHGLNHDGKYLISRQFFANRAVKINHYIRDWEAVGFRMPSMLRNLDWLHDLNIEYDASTFDTDPFEPDPKGVGTIFPFLVSGQTAGDGFVELPYTLPQDFTVFVILREKKTDVWKKKLEWVAERGGMALMNTHPDYMAFSGRSAGEEEYPFEYYERFLGFVDHTYGGTYWNALPREMAAFCKRVLVAPRSA